MLKYLKNDPRFPSAGRGGGYDIDLHVDSEFGNDCLNWSLEWMFIEGSLGSDLIGVRNAPRKWFYGSAVSIATSVIAPASSVK
jgi:hypothetical protein